MTDMPMTTDTIGPHPDNLLADGTYDPRMYDLNFEKIPGRRGAYRVIRGLGNHIGNVLKVGEHLWATFLPREDSSQPNAGLGERFGHEWQSRRVAGHMLSHKVPLTADADEEQFRVPSPS